MINFKTYQDNCQYFDINEEYIILDKNQLLSARTHIEQLLLNGDAHSVKADCELLLKELDNDYAELVKNDELFHYFNLLQGDSTRFIDLFYKLAQNRLTGFLNEIHMMPTYTDFKNRISERKYPENNVDGNFTYFVEYYLKKKSISRNNFTWFLHKNICPSYGLIQSEIAKPIEFPTRKAEFDNKYNFFGYFTGFHWAQIDRILINKRFYIEDEIKIRLTPYDIIFISCFDNLKPDEIVYFSTKWDDENRYITY